MEKKGLEEQNTHNSQLKNDISGETTQILDHSYDFSSIIRGTYEDASDIFNSFDASMVKNFYNDEASSKLNDRMKKQLGNMEGTLSKKEKLSQILTEKELNCFSGICHKKEAINEYYRTLLKNDYLIGEFSIMLRASLEAKSNRISNDIKQYDSVFSDNKLDLRQLNKKLEGGYEEKVTFGRNSYNQNFYQQKYTTESQDPRIRNELKVMEKVKKQEARKWVFDLSKQQKAIQKRVEDRKHKRDSLEEKQFKRMLKSYKKGKEDIKQKRVDSCYQRMKNKKTFTQRLSDLQKREDKYIKIYMAQKPLYTKHTKKMIKKKEDHYKSGLQKHKELHKPVRQDDIKKHQENYDELKKNKLPYFNPQKLHKKIDFFNNKEMRTKGYETTNYPRPKFFSSNHDKSYFEIDIDNSLNSDVMLKSYISKEVDYRPFDIHKLKSKDEMTYLELKKKKFSELVNTNNLESIRETNKGRPLKRSLPFLKKQQDRTEERNRVGKIISKNKELQINNQEHSKEIGKRSQPQLNKSIISKSCTGLPALKSQIKTQKSHVSGDNQWNPDYWNADEQKKLPKHKNLSENNTSDISYWRKKCQSLSFVNNREFDSYIKQIDAIEGRANEKSKNFKNPLEFMNEPSSFSIHKNASLTTRNNNVSSDVNLSAHAPFNFTQQDKNNEAGFIYSKAAKAKLALQDVLLDDTNRNNYGKNVKPIYDTPKRYIRK